MASQQWLSVVAAPPSIQTPRGLHYTLMGRNGKPIEGIWGRVGKAMYGHWEPYRQAICHDVEPHLAVPALGPGMSDRIPFKPHCTLSQCHASRPNRHLPHSEVLSPSPHCPATEVECDV
ncbi:unnamed protein product [Pleuronectes platessa]|uniref:Uncharacterized protein n=1 Tax=Pleuronectes platessa TaxID=8262 RepID=A0A9N7TT52_PLEPL|nr:unnamed protein product [Pleuronectes platessa]